MRRRQALAYRLALSTNSGAPNQPAGGGGGGSFITSGIYLVSADDGTPIALTSSAYSDIPSAIHGDRITFNSRIKLWDVDRSYASGTISPLIHLVARTEEGV